MSTRLHSLREQIVACRRCARLVAHREHVGRDKRRAYRDHEYWARPVPGFGAPGARIVFVGLAPGAHGSNRTGRMFTGDASGDFLFPALHRAGLASRPDATGRDDGLRLRDCYITAAVRCAPPNNKPTANEKAACLPYLIEEFALLSSARVYVCLGRIAFDQTQRALAVRLGRFAHGARFRLQAGHVLCSYHVSRQNTQTGRLTRTMFDRILASAKRLAGL